MHAAQAGLGAAAAICASAPTAPADDPLCALSAVHAQRAEPYGHPQARLLEHAAALRLPLFRRSLRPDSDASGVHLHRQLALLLSRSLVCWRRSPGRPPLPSCSHLLLLLVCLLLLLLLLSLPLLLMLRHLRLLLLQFCCALRRQRGQSRLLLPASQQLQGQGKVWRADSQRQAGELHAAALAPEQLCLL